MSEVLTKITKEAIALDYADQKALLDSLTISVQNLEKKQNSECDWAELLDSYMGCLGGLWSDDDPIEYQRNLREDRIIG